MYSLVENKLISIFHLFPSHPSAVCQEYVGPSASTFSLPQPPQKLGLLKPLRIFPEGKTTRIWTTTQSSNPRFFPAQENSQSASLCFISTAQRGFQRHMRESLQPATELSIHSEIHSTKEPGPSRVSVPFITVAYIRITFLQEITYQVSILSMQLARGYPRFLGVLCVRSM